MVFGEWTVLAVALFAGVVLGTLYRLARKSSSAGSKTPLQNASQGGQGQNQGAAQRVLVADDSATVRKVLELTLMKSCLDVVEAGSAAEARELLDNGVFALAFIDAHLVEPEEGYGLFQLCRQVAPQMPVILLTGTFEPDVDPTHALEAQGVIKKPFDSKEVLALVHQLTGVGAGS